MLIRPLPPFLVRVIVGGDFPIEERERVPLRRFFLVIEDNPTEEQARGKIKIKTEGGSILCRLSASTGAMHKAGPREMYG